MSDREVGWRTLILSGPRRVPVAQFGPWPWHGQLGALCLRGERCLGGDRTWWWLMNPCFEVDVVWWSIWCGLVKFCGLEMRWCKFLIYFVGSMMSMCLMIEILHFVEVKWLLIRLIDGRDCVCSALYLLYVIWELRFGMLRKINVFVMQLTLYNIL